MAARYFDDIRALARELLPELAAALGPRFDVLVDTIIAVFDGEVVHRFVLTKPEARGGAARAAAGDDANADGEAVGLCPRCPKSIEL